MLHAGQIFSNYMLEIELEHYNTEDGTINAHYWHQYDRNVSIVLSNCGYMCATKEGNKLFNGESAFFDYMRKINISFNELEGRCYLLNTFTGYGNTSHGSMRQNFVVFVNLNRQA